MTANNPDRAWLLKALKGEVRTNAALRQCQIARAQLKAGTLPPELAAALEEGDKRFPPDVDPVRHATVSLGPAPVETDAATTEAVERRLEELHEPQAQAAGEGAFLLDELSHFLGRFVAFPSDAARAAVTLWAAHAHMAQWFESTPRLAVLSPEPGSGKTRVLEVLELVVPRPQHVFNASVAAVFRMIEQYKPTLLFDEVDAIFGRSGKGDDSTEDLRALLNAGHRRSATIPRCVGPNHQVQHYAVYAPAALAGLGDLPDTLMSRSVVIRMRRRAPHERVESFRRRRVEPEGHELRDALAEWARQVGPACGEAWPEMPPGIVDRPADVWEPLLAVADAAGGHWPTTAREACVALVAAAQTVDDQSLGIRLLADVREAFAGADRLPTATIIERLTAMEEAPWGNYRGKGPIDARWLARRLKAYGIVPSLIRFDNGPARGYTAADFEDAWARYLPEGVTSVTSVTSQVSATRPVTDVTAVTLLPETDGAADEVSR